MNTVSSEVGASLADLEAAILRVNDAFEVLTTGQQLILMTALAKDFLGTAPKVVNCRPGAGETADIEVKMLATQLTLPHPVQPLRN